MSCRSLKQVGLLEQSKSQACSLRYLHPQVSSLAKMKSRLEMLQSYLEQAKYHRADCSSQLERKKGCSRCCSQTGSHWKPDSARGYFRTSHTPNSMFQKCCCKQLRQSLPRISRRSVLEPMVQDCFEGRWWIIEFRSSPSYSQTHIPRCSEQHYPHTSRTGNSTILCMSCCLDRRPCCCSLVRICRPWSILLPVARSHSLMSQRQRLA